MEQTVFDYNILGIDNSRDVDKNKKKHTTEIINIFKQFAEKIEQETQINFHRYLYGNLSNEEAQKTLMKHESVQESMKHIPGKLSEMKFRKNKLLIIDAILEKIHELKQYGETERIYQTDFKSIKKMLLMKLFKLFSSNLDLENFEYTIINLKKMKMIPAHVTCQEMEQYCPIGRWS